MNKIILIFALLLISAFAYAEQISSDIIPPLNAENPARFGFQHFAKCHGEAKSLGDTKSAEACLAACKTQPNARGCWWLDGTGGIDRECRICLDGPPSRDIFSNDWGIPTAH